MRGFDIKATGLVWLFLVLPYVTEAAQPQRSQKLRSEVVSKLALRSGQAKIRARLWAHKQGMPVFSRLPDGTGMQLMDVFGDRPVYFSTFNHNAAIASGASVLSETLDFDLDGTNFAIGLWDQNMPLDTHQEFLSSPSRISMKDETDLSDHATQVAGTLGAVGINHEATGMAPNVRIEAYNWEDDLAEMAAIAASYPNEPNMLYVSNHSYGISLGWSYTDLAGKQAWHWMPEWFGGISIEPMFGQYSQRTAALDELTWNAPYYLPFVAAGNDRNDNPNKGAKVYYSEYRGGNLIWKKITYNDQSPSGDGKVNNGYDTLHIAATAKNIITVGAATQTVLGGVRDLSQSEVSYYSAFGPTDDGRVKPDLVAQGNSLTTTSSNTHKAYTVASGTSLSCPSASGSAMLLVQYYDRLFKDEAMRASTLKGLLLHTADDLLQPGPDYQTGWGLINVNTAAQLIRLHANAAEGHHLMESTLDSKQDVRTYHMVIKHPQKITLTLCWTDPDGQPTEDHDNRQPALVHDLDLRVLLGKKTYLPFTLNPLRPEQQAVPGDNVLDNVEQVIIDPAEPGTYVIRVSSKSLLVTPVQWYSLISDAPLLSEM